MLKNKHLKRHRIYWKIFLSFWLSSSIIIVSTIWVTGVVHRQSSIPLREKIILNNYAHAAIATFESGKTKALNHYLKQIFTQKKLQLFLISPTKTVLPLPSSPRFLKKIQLKYQNSQLQDGLIKNKHYLVSSEIMTLKGNLYRLVAITTIPISHQLLVPWLDVLNEMLFAIFISGVLCYFLSHYLTKPIADLRKAAHQISYGQLETRLSNKLLNRKDEIGCLSQEFNNMAEHIDLLISAKERLLQDISHELRSPLARLQIAVALCQSKTNNDGQEDIERMELEITRLDQLIGKILSLAKLQDPHKKLELKKVDLIEMVNTLIHDANYEYKQKNINIIFNHSKECIVNVDELLIHSALENILRNALRYTPENSKISISLTNKNNIITYEVSDQGEGVPKQDLESIFKPFYRVDSARPTTTGGYGIGLALTKKAIELHKGTIVANNLKPQGLSIKFMLPLHR